MPQLTCENIRKTYKLGRVRVPVLHGVSLEVDEGEWVAILGASGSGKSTLLHLLGGLDRPDRSKDSQTRPSINFESTELTSLSKPALDRYKARDVGFVFQFYHLLPELNVLDNVLIADRINRGLLSMPSADSTSRARQLLSDFGLATRLKHRPVELSGGERQRVAIARALINQPKLLLADEPTGNLDRETGDKILDNIDEQRKKLGLTMIMVTHDPILANRADRILTLEDGLMTSSKGPAATADSAP